MSKRAIVSVYNKEGVEYFCRSLIDAGYEIISTGNTAAKLKAAGIAHKEVSEVTGFPEILGGRVKTLHPKVAAGILARDLPEDKEALAKLDIDKIDLVCVNLYPFKETLLKEGVTHADLIEKIDIGGPTMLRAAAKNYKEVTVICDIDDYAKVCEELKEKGEISYKTREKLAAKVFRHTAEYDSCVAAYFSRAADSDGESEVSAEETAKIVKDIKESPIPSKPFEKSLLSFGYSFSRKLRYGENPAQDAAVFETSIPAEHGIMAAEILNGKELSYNNISDADAAISTVYDFQGEKACCVALKHANPCGIAVADSPEEAYLKAYASDPVSIFGGIVAQNKKVSAAQAEEMSKIFLEIVIAPDYSDEALAILKKKKNLRVLRLPALAVHSSAAKSKKERSYVFKPIIGGILLQEADDLPCEDEEYKTVTSSKLDEGDLADCVFAVKACKHIKSNAICLVKDQATVGIGAGQPNRVTAAEIAIKMAGEKAEDAILGSDAFLPFNDTIKAAHAAKVKAVVETGGSIRDEDTLKFAEEVNMPVVFTGVRHFKH